MQISHIGQSILRTPHDSLQLKNVLHVPSASKNLLSVHKLTLDNNAFMEFHPWFFLIKDRDTRRILCEGRCYGGLYLLVPTPTESSKQAFITIKPSSSTWHHRLGHPSSFVVQQVLRKNNISYSSEINPYICDSYQLAKSHQLPYPVSTSVSTVPLKQVFSDVWGPAPESFGKHSYYVSFIDDFSKFTWIYLLKKHSDVYQVFLNFQQLVERKFDRKIITMQTDWGGEYEKLNSFFQKVGITHHVSCPHAHQQNDSAERKHRHIVEVGLALLATASMPLKFWDEAFLTATFLINLLPSKVINHDTPKPNYESLRILVVPVGQISVPTT
jgi:histone deacetylase 1/2